jgi:hypothetical protein
MTYRKFFLLALGAALVFIFRTESQAQSGRTTKPVTGSGSSTMQVQLPTPTADAPVPLVTGNGRDIPTLSFVTPDTNFERILVKGSPFSADSVTEHVQVLADGNRMGRKSTAHIYRDGAGRTRRDHELTRGNAAGPDGQPPRLIIINDPVARVNYTIETQTGVARKRQLPPQRILEQFEKARGDNAPFSVLIPTSTAHRRMAEGDKASPMPTPQREKLPAQTIEGVLAEGTRTTLIIPAGEFDNEQPMTIIHEEWYAPELQMIVLMKHNDPRFGETTFRLTNIMRGDPAGDLFQLPQGYKVVEGFDRSEMMGPRTGPPRRTP